MPFYNVIKLSPSGFVLCSIALVVAILTLATEFVIDLLKKNKKLNYIATCLFGAVIVYLLLPFGPLNITNILKLVSTVTIVYLVYVNKDKLNFKNLVFFLLIGFLIACAFEPLRFISDRLEWFLPDFPAHVGKQKRFSGLTSDPNYFSVEVLLLSTCLTQLYFSKKINTVFYPLLFILSIIGFLTISKAYLITFFVYVLLTIILLLLKKISNFD